MLNMGARELQAANFPAPPAIDNVPDDWGPKYYSEIADIALTRRGPDEIGFVVDSHFLLVLLTPQPKRETALASSRTTVFDAPAGSVEVIPAGASFQGRWTVAKENILVSLHPQRLAEFAAREFDAGGVEMQPVRPGTSDRTAAQLAGLMRDCMDRQQGVSRLYLESLNTALMLHFIRCHTSLGAQGEVPQFRGGLSPRSWRELEGFMHANLDSDLTLASLASRAGLSYSHFLRAFRQTAGVPPHRYILLLRANRARELAETTRLPLKQIAAQCGFANQSHMTTVMKTLLHVTPGHIRREAGAPPERDDEADEVGAMAGPSFRANSEI